MAGITLAQAQAQLDTWLAASTAASGNQSYTMPDGRALTRANAKEIRENIEYWDSKVKELDPSNNRINVRRATPIT